jgi:hypothetical protein
MSLSHQRETETKNQGKDKNKKLSQKTMTKDPRHSFLVFVYMFLFFICQKRYFELADEKNYLLAARKAKKISPTIGKHFFSDMHFIHKKLKEENQPILLRIRNFDIVNFLIKF